MFYHCIVLDHLVYCPLFTFQDADKRKLSPRAPSSPQVRRLRAFQPTGADQSQPCQEDSLRLPRLLAARGSLPVLSNDNEAERFRRRFQSLTPDKTVKELSPRREAFNHRSISPRNAEKQQISLNVGNEWFSELSSNTPEGEVPDNKDSTSLEDDVAFCWNSDDEDEDDDTDEDPLACSAAQNEKKVHSIEEIKYTRYLRMKSPHHWLPKMGNVPKNLLSSSIIVGHTKVAFNTSKASVEEDDDDADEQSCEEIKEDGEIGEATQQCKTSGKEENGLETNKENNYNSELEENSTIN